MNRLEDMRIFARVAELANFTRAAESLGLPKATVSASVQRLEEAMGTRLLHRTTRRVSTTHDGATFYERCKDLLSDIDEVETMFRKNDAEITGRLRVDMPIGVARHLVVPKLAEFITQYPGIEIELSSTDRRVDVVREGFDCVIRIGSLIDSELISRSLGHLSLVNCASPAYLSKFGRPRKLEDLSKHRLVHYVPTLGSKPGGFEYFDGKAYRTIEMAGSVTVNSSDAYQAACLSGLGIIQAPLVGVAAHLKAGRLIEILPKHRAEPMPVSLIYPHRRNLAVRVRLFLNWVESIMKNYVR